MEKVRPKQSNHKNQKKKSAKNFPQDILKDMEKHKSVSLFVMGPAASDKRCSDPAEYCKLVDGGLEKMRFGRRLYDYCKLVDGGLEKMRFGEVESM
jgi:hypothetical protein